MREIWGFLGFGGKEYRKENPIHIRSHGNIYCESAEAGKISIVSGVSIFPETNPGIDFVGDLDFLKEPQAPQKQKHIP